MALFNVLHVHLDVAHAKWKILRIQAVIFYVLPATMVTSCKQAPVWLSVQITNIRMLTLANVCLATIHATNVQIPLINV